MNDVTRILSAIAEGDAQAAEQLLPLVWEELRKLASAALAHKHPGQPRNLAEKVTVELAHTASGTKRN